MREEDNWMSSESTQAAARKQLYRHFVRTLRALPVESALSLLHPDLPRARLHNGVTLPWDVTDPNIDSVFFDIAYWITGTAPDDTDRYFELIVRSWNAFGWPTRIEGDTPPRAAYTRTSDHFGMSVRQTVDGYLSLAGSTPPFAPDTAEGTPLPQIIPHPLGTPKEPGSTTPSPDAGKQRSTPWLRDDPR